MKHLLCIIPLLLFSCKNDQSTNSSKLTTKANCRIFDFKNQNLEGRDKITGLEFKCKSDSTTFLFKPNNPFAKLGLKKFEVSNDRYADKADAKLFFEKGNADFDLKGESFESLNTKLGNILPAELAQMEFPLAKSMCSVQHDADFAKVTYFFNLYGNITPHVTSSVFATSHLIILNSNGKVMFDKSSNKKVFTNPRIQKDNQLLFYRSDDRSNSNIIQGGEIVDLKNGNQLLDFKLNEGELMSAPTISSKDFILFESKRKSYQDFYVYDVQEKLLKKKSVVKHHRYIPEKIEGNKLILKSQKNGETEYSNLDFRIFETIPLN